MGQTPEQFGAAVVQYGIPQPQAEVWAQWALGQQPPPPDTFLEHLSQSIFPLTEQQIDANMPIIADRIFIFLQQHTNVDRIVMGIKSDDSSQQWMADKFLAHINTDSRFASYLQNPIEFFYLKPVAGSGQKTLGGNEFSNLPDTTALLIVDDWSIDGQQVNEELVRAKSAQRDMPIFIGLHMATQQAENKINRWITNFNHQNISFYAVQQHLSSALDDQEQRWIDDNAFAHFDRSIQAIPQAQTPILGIKYATPDNGTLFYGWQEIPPLISPVVPPYRRGVKP